MATAAIGMATASIGMATNPSLNFSICSCSTILSTNNTTSSTGSLHRTSRARRTQKTTATATPNRPSSPHPPAVRHRDCPSRHHHDTTRPGTSPRTASTRSSLLHLHSACPTRCHRLRWRCPSPTLASPLSTHIPTPHRRLGRPTVAHHSLWTLSPSYERERTKGESN